MIDFNVKEHAHTRLNILTGEWVLIPPTELKALAGQSPANNVEHPEWH